MKAFKPEGVIVPLLTPFRQDGSLDEQTLRRSARRLIAAGVHGLFPAGSSGEFWALDVDERCKAIEIVVQEAEGRVPVYAGTGHISTQGTVQLTRRAESLGADAVVVITPFYVAPTQQELYTHYATVAGSTSLLVFPYNNPKRTGGVSLEPATLIRLARHQNLAGIKDSSGNLALTAEFINQAPDGFAVFQGSDDLFFPSLAMGAVGMIAATGNVAPEIVVELYQAYIDGDWERSRAAQVKLASLRRATSWGSYPAVLKAAMAIIGEPVGLPRPPVAPLDDSRDEALRQVLAGMGLALDGH